MHARVVGHGRVRDFLGFNRAKHAVLEAAILATRIHLVPADELSGEVSRLERIVEKTGGRQETLAFALLLDHVQQASQRAIG
jgi:hypothetical protein